ncbi:MAG: DPP IV N-terminal domain-containing protein [Anaerolineae bacterium]
MATISNIGSDKAASARIDGLPASSLRFDWIFALLCVWLVGGLFLDGWAHSHGYVDNTFFTPWHGILYSGALVILLFLAINYVRYRVQGYTLLKALPAGYMLSLVGAFLFLMSGGFDLVWHSIIGFEVNLETLLSPAHLLLATTGVLMVTGPIRSVWAQYRAGEAHGWRKLGPAIIGLLTLLSIFTFFTDFANATSRVEYAAISKAGDNTQLSDEYVMNADGSGQMRLTNVPNGSGWGGSWSPDGSKIIYSRHQSRGDGSGDLWLMNADGSEQTQLTSLPGSEFLPSWSPDGSKIIFIYGVDGASDIYVMNANGSDAHALVKTDSAEYLPVWSPDGTKILFTSNRDGGTDHLFVMDADGSNVVQVTHTGAYNYGGHWFPSAGSNKIIFHSSQNGENLDIYLIDVDGSNLTRLTYDAAWDANPQFSPDGRSIIFESWRSGRNDMYVMNAACVSEPTSCDGMALNVSNAPALDTSLPCYSPDGKKILYTAWGYSSQPPTYLTEGLGIAGALLQTVLTMGVILFAVRRYRLPFGALTLILTVNAAAMTVLSDAYFVDPVRLCCGVDHEVLLWWLKPIMEQRGRFYLPAFLKPIVYFALYFTAVTLTRGADELQCGWHNDDLRNAGCSQRS